MTLQTPGENDQRTDHVAWREPHHGEPPTPLLRERWREPAAALIGLALLTAACGTSSTEDLSSQATPLPEPTPIATTAPLEMPTLPPAPSAAAVAEADTAPNGSEPTPPALPTATAHPGAIAIDPTPTAQDGTEALPPTATAPHTEPIAPSPTATTPAPAPDGSTPPSARDDTKAGRDYTAAAEALEVTVEEIQAALGGPPPDFEAAAAILDTTADTLRELIGVPAGHR